MHFFDLATIKPSPWKNGGGHTREIACWPAGATMDTFDWRVSVATIAASGPFSAFAGVDRQIMLLDGDGVTLHGDGFKHTLAPRWQPFAFSGDQPVDCTLLGGTSTDFNLMLRRGRWQGQVQVIDQACQPGASAAGLCVVLSGEWQTASGQRLGPGQGIWWHAAQADAPAYHPLPGTPTAHMAWVALSPT